MLSLTTSNDTTLTNSDTMEKNDAEMYASSNSVESGDEKTKRPSPSPPISKGPSKSHRVQEFQPLKCRCERTFVGIAEFVLHAQTCPELMVSTENAVDLSFQSKRPDINKLTTLAMSDALDLTVRGSESATNLGQNATNPTLSCPECKIVTANHMQLLRHFESAHGAYGNYACPCGVEFGWLPAYLSHYLLCPLAASKKPHSGSFDNSFIKKHISMQFKPSKPPIVGNQQTQPDLSRPFKCCHCVKSFKSKALLDQHMHIHYPPKYTCRYCAKKYRWPPVFYHHQRTCKKRPAVPTATSTGNSSAIGRASEPVQSRGYASRTTQASPYQFPPIPPPTSLPIPPPFLLNSSNQEQRPPNPSSLLLPPPPSSNIVRPWERKEGGAILNMSPFRLPSFPLPLGANPELLRFPGTPSLPLPPPPPMLPFYSAFDNQTPNLCSEGANVTDTSNSPVTCVCGTNFDGLSPYLSHIATCPLFGRALSIPPPQLDDTNPALFLANMISVLEKCKPEFFQQFLNRNSPRISQTQGEALDMAGGNSCDQCGKEFSSRLSLKQHVEGKHSTEGKYQCPGCAKRYRWGASYYYHKKSCPAVSNRDDEDIPLDEVLEGSPSNLINSEESEVCSAMLFHSAAKELLEHQQEFQETDPDSSNVSSVD
ncbi:unnamed protein product [Rodentolepis nana]|uniref:C2H2-type domain-containing protein n=1 Tax=Rodentolepis nana TaxID=102285 RepID=A0A0R3TWM5_RODNA|nr:unnamed protein product [Rodentolepis nana]